LTVCAAALSAVLPASPLLAETRMWVNVDDGVRRTCPSMTCGTIGRFFAGESVVVYESADGWSRVSRYYSAGCHGGRSSFVDAGPSECTPQNGIRDGEFAEWIRSNALAAEESDTAG
jgi:hypothetical protein